MEFTSGFLLSLSLCLDIGVANIAMITLAMQRGYFQGFALGLGTCVGDLIYAVLALAGVLALASTQWDVQHKEAVLADGQKIFMRLQPVDPRSLLQGDYMALRFAYPAHVHEALTAQQTTAP